MAPSYVQGVSAFRPAATGRLGSSPGHRATRRASAIATTVAGVRAGVDGLTSGKGLVVLKRASGVASGAAESVSTMQSQEQVLRLRTSR